MDAPADVWTPVLLGNPIPPRRRILTPIQEAQAIAQAEAWLDKGVIEEIPTPPLVNNLVLVAKKNGQVRVCIDCTPANQVTESYDWPLPRIQDVRFRVVGASHYSRIDLKDAFFRIKVPVRFRRLTAFRAGGRTYQFRRMPFGLKTAPSTFQEFMDRGLSQFEGWAVWYIDDILITAESEAQLRLRERLIRKQLGVMGCEINEAKSESNKTVITFLGLTVFKEGVGPDRDKALLASQLTPPTTKAEAQSALGLVSYLRDFTPLISHFTAMLYPDKNGLRLDIDEYAREWRRLTAHLASALTVTHHWREGLDAMLYTDASQYGLGAIVLQDQRIVALASRKLSPAETRYSATDREHLGLVFAAQKFRLLLHRANATTQIWTDHSALVTRQEGMLTPRQARWHQIVTHWMPKIAHIPGKANPADFISRWRFQGVGGKF